LRADPISFLEVGFDCGGELSDDCIGRKRSSGELDKLFIFQFNGEVFAPILVSSFHIIL